MAKVKYTSEAQFVSDQMAKADAANADMASVGYDGNKYAMLVNSGTALSQMSDGERSYIKSHYQYTPSTTYKNNALDQYLASVGLPPSSDLSKYRTAYSNYTAGGGIEENYGNLSDDQWKKINELWQKDWEYNLTDTDYKRRAAGLAPSSYDDMYEDTLLDDELKARGLPPSKLLNGKLGEAYNTWVKDDETYNKIMTEFVNYVLENKSDDPDDSLAMMQLNQLYESGYAKLFENPEYAEFLSSHGYVRETLPSETDDKYQLQDKWGNPIDGEYDYQKWNEDYQKAFAKNAKIDADEFAITLEAAEAYYDEHAQDVLIQNAAMKFVTTNNIDIQKMTDEQADAALSYAIGQSLRPMTFKDLFGETDLTEDDRVIYQPIINEYNRLMKSEGIDAANAYLGSEQYQKDLNASIRQNIIDTYRASFTPGSANASKSDDEIYGMYVDDVAHEYVITDSDVIAKMKSGEMSLYDYLSQTCASEEGAIDLANRQFEQYCEDNYIPMKDGKVDYETLRVNRQKHDDANNYLFAQSDLVKFTPYLDYLYKNDDSDLYQWKDAYQAIVDNHKPGDDDVEEYLDAEQQIAYIDRVLRIRSEVEAIDPLYYKYKTNIFGSSELAMYDRLRNTRVGFQYDALAYTDAYKSWVENTGNEYVNQRFDEIVYKHADSLTHGQDEKIASYATDEEKYKTVYIFDKMGHELSDGSKISSTFAEAYLNETLMRKWDASRRDDQKSRTGLYGGQYWGSESDNGFVKVAGATGTTLAHIFLGIGEGVANFGYGTATFLSGKTLYSSNLVHSSSDRMADLSQHLNEATGNGVASFFVQLIPSMAQSGASAIAAWATGGASEWLTLALMSTQSYSEGVDTALSRGASTGEAYAFGLAQGFAEMFFEKVSLDSMLKNMDNATFVAIASAQAGATRKETIKQVTSTIIKSALAQGFVAEGTEELFTEIAGWVNEAVFLGYNSTSFAEAVSAYVKSGYTQDQAEAMAGKELWKEAIVAYLGGAVSGLLMAGPSDVLTIQSSAQYALARLESDAKNLSAISYDQALNLAKEAAIKDANGNVTKEGAQAIVEALRAKGADSATMSYVMNSIDTTEDVRGVFDNAILEMRRSESARLAKVAADVVARSQGLSKIETQSKLNYMNTAATNYLNALTETLQTADKASLAKAVDAQRNGFLDVVKRESGISYREGMRIVSDYMRTIDEDELNQGAVPYMSAMKLAALKSNTKVNRNAAAYYGTYAYALTKMASDANFLSAFTGLFGRTTADVSTNVRNACLNSAQSESIAFVDNALAAIGMFDSMGSGSMSKVLSRGMYGAAYVTSVLAASEASMPNSDSRLLYNYISRNGVTGAVLDALSVAKYYENMPADSRARADKYARTGMDAFMTSEETAAESDAVESAEKNAQAKAKAVQAQKAHNDQTLAVSQNIVERHKASYDAVTASETVVIEGQVLQTTSADLADVAASYAAALSDAINARDNLAKANEDRLQGAKNDLELAQKRLREARRKFKAKMNRHTAAYMNMIGSQLETMRNGNLVSNAEFDRITALANYGTREDLNNAVQRIIQTEKRQAAAFANEIGAQMEIVKFTKEFMDAHGATYDPNKVEAGFEHNGRVYLNETAFGTNKGAHVGYGVNEVILHEIGHVAEKAANNWTAYSKFAVEYMIRQYGDRAVRFIEALGQKGVSELTAEFTRLELLQNQNLITDLCKNAPTFSIRMHQWLKSITGAMTGSLTNMSTYNRAERLFARALGEATTKVRSEINNEVKKATEKAVSSNNEMVETNADAVSKESKTEATDDYIPEAPPEEGGAYGYEADANAFSDINSGWRLGYDATGRNAVGSQRNTGSPIRRRWKPGSYDFTKDWSDQVQDVYDLGDGKDARPYNENMLVGRTPEILRKLGFAQLPVLYTEKHTEQNLYGKQDGSNPLDHLLDRADLDEIYKAIENPIAVIVATDDPNETPEKLAERKDKRTRSERSVVMYIDVKSKSGERVVVPITLEGEGTINGQRVDANVITSMHGRQNGIGQLVSAFYNESNGNPSILYWNKQKVQKAVDGENNIRKNGKRIKKDGSLQSKWLRLPNSLPTSSFPHSIADFDIPVKTRISSQEDTQQFKRFAGENPQYVEKDGERYVKGKNGMLKSMNEDTNFGLFDNAIDDPNYFNDFNAAEYDDEYMELGEAYRDGRASLSDIARLSYLVQSAAMAKGILTISVADPATWTSTGEGEEYIDRPEDLYHGTPPWNGGWGFTAFRGDVGRDNQKNLAFTANNPNAAFSYTGAVRAYPHSRELWKRGKLGIDQIVRQKYEAGGDVNKIDYYEDAVTWNDYIDLAERTGRNPYDILREDVREILGDVPVSFGDEPITRTDATATLALYRIEKLMRQFTDTGNLLNGTWESVENIANNYTDRQFNKFPVDGYNNESVREYIDVLSTFIGMASDVAYAENADEAKDIIHDFAEWYGNEYLVGNDNDSFTVNAAAQYLKRFFPPDVATVFEIHPDEDFQNLGKVLNGNYIDRIASDVKTLADSTEDRSVMASVLYAQEAPMEIGIDQLVRELAENRRAGMYHLYGQKTDNPYEFTSSDGDWSDLVYYGKRAIYGEHRKLASSREGLQKLMSGEINPKNFEGLDAGRRVNDTNNNAEYARRLGYTMARFNNLFDSDKQTLNYMEATDDLIFFNQKGLKSADLITVDDNGKIVPLSQRFNWDDTDLNHYTELQDSINDMPQSARERCGNPRLMQGAQGMLAVRNVSLDGFLSRNQQGRGARNIAVLERADLYASGQASLFLSPIDLENAVAVVSPSGKEFGDVRNAAWENNATVVTYDLNDPSTFENAIRAAAQADGSLNAFHDINELLAQYGAYDEEETRRTGGRLVPQRTSPTNRVHRTLHTLANSQYTTDAQYENGIKPFIENDLGSYEPVSNNRTLNKAKNDIARLGGVRQALTHLNDSVATNTGKNTELLAMAESILMDADAMQSLGQTEYEQLLTDISLVAEDSGRSLQLLRELASLSPQGRINHLEQTGKRMAARYEQKTKKPVDLSLTAEEKKAYGEAKTQDEFDEIDEKVTERWGQLTKDLPLLDRIRNWRYFSMLGNLRTHFRNIVGNLIMHDVARVKDSIKSLYELGIDKQDRTATFITKRMDDATKAFVERETQIAIPLMQNASMKYYQAAKKFGNADSKMTWSKFWDEVKKDVPSAHISNSDKWLGRTLNKASSANSNALELEDALALGNRFKSVLAQQIQAKGLDVNKIPEWQKKRMIQYAMEESLRATFRDASPLADALNQFEKTNKVTRLAMGAIVPFKKTPINIVKRGIEYSPIGLMQGLYKTISNKVSYEQQLKNIDNSNLKDVAKEFRKNEALTKFKNERISAINRLAEGTTGTLLAAIGLIAAQFGWISIGRKDDDQAAFETALGKNSYSLNIGDVSIDLSAFSPAAIPLLIGAAAHGAIKAAQDGDESFVPGLVTALTETLDPITEMTMLSGIADAFSGLSYSNNDDAKNTQWAGTLARNTVASFVSQFIPTLVGQAARIADPYARSYSAGKDYWASKYIGTESGSKVKSLQNKLPFAAWLSEPKVDVHGNKVGNYTNWGAGLLHVLNNTVLPATIKMDQKTDIDEELVRLYGVVDSSEIFPTKPSRTIGSYKDKNGDTVNIKLDNDAEYTEYQMEVGQVTYDALDDLMRSSAYARMDDTQKANAVENTIKNARNSVKKLWKAKKQAGK